ncbi:chloride channel protein [Streptococcus panodentis]|uniref:Voltage-gated chloride channel protein n=1 Tax=Streptococcus panodentis TaxID=1581472 RepID=A0ABS5AWZ2_9STRE|nr:chloride channel protein [Streptococcus panodentis]MBP2621102.1 voltage-gated chloride channel protein [Streptococcus panodentis]
MKKIKAYPLLAVLAVVIGGIVGMVDTVFGRVLLYLSDFRGEHIIFLLPILPFAGLLIDFLYQRCGGSSRKGMTLVFAVGHGEEDEIPKRLIPLIIVSTWLTHLFGGSAGREGVAVQLGAAVSNWFSSRFRIKDVSKIFLITGMSAGFAGLFQTPLAAAFFAMEVLVVGRLELSAFLPAVIAALTASWTSHTLVLEKFTFPLEQRVDWSIGNILKLLLLGLLFGLAGKAFALALSWAKKKAALRFKNPYIRILMLGLLLTGLLLFLDRGRYAGLGTNLISASLHQGRIYPYDWLLKLALTVLTLAAGYQGGEVTPLFAIGASLGTVLAPLMGFPLAFTAALGYAAVFGSATSTLLGPILIGCEVFGFAYLPYFSLVCLTAFVLKHDRSIYGAQKVMDYQNMTLHFPKF